MTASQKQLVKQWVKLLRVQDWELTWKEKARFKGEPGTTGWAKPKPSMKTATLAVRKGLGAKEFERTVIHELLHVLFPMASMMSLADSAANAELEQGIEVLARLLMELAHANRRR